ncbi:uncharacterized protein PHALS_10647 [Plasmopara halstedii]|uniref:WRKY19-like zinc finger domain-containing protein n=1 Tax=Plasmopara halstedii TaxID=4781 RepID=A0A0P1AGZ9_PLAHL|nr:uncharacterized protein PHALS_10647 [Plasmopara halstedii]CEG40447.1 hypothetical protein PHALS_10647 [Plasmopara halstedii]|eukprot:XP_024576816.1 hypothetical protein PHALS_10647 [Plasmopara halstedii]
MDPQLSPITISSYNIGDIFNSPATMDLLDDEDFESTMMMLDSAVFRTEDPDNVELHFNGLSDSFNPRSPESPLATSGHRMISASGQGLSVGVTSYLQPDVKLQSSSETPVGADVYIKQEGTMPGFSPTVDSFIRESWSDIAGLNLRAFQTSLQPPNHSGSLTISVTPGRTNPLPLNMLHLGTVPLPPPTLCINSNTLSNSLITSVHSTKSKSTRRAKQCITEGCARRAQSNNRCKTHGGGARCQVENCGKSSQGGGLCRAHGGGKKCRVPGCSKGTQRLGLCYLHGGIRRCIMDGCKKKDRGNGYCISHGGGRRCEAGNCNRSVRKGNHCQIHQGVLVSKHL